MFDHDYKATIGVDFEIERFEIVGIPYSLQMYVPDVRRRFPCSLWASFPKTPGEGLGELLLSCTL